MSRLIESIKLLDGRFSNLFYHEQRMNDAFKRLYGSNEKIMLQKLLEEYAYPRQGLHKCRIVYDATFREVTFTPYRPKSIGRIKVVEDEMISYEFKFEDRTQINDLFELRGECDDVLVVKGGRVTDCSFSNIVFRKDQYWFTPASPLLKGTMRQNLLDKKYIQEREINKDEIHAFESFRIINAMLEFDSPEIVVSNIVF